jgi:hypothetical protein
MTTPRSDEMTHQRHDSRPDVSAYVPGVARDAAKSGVLTYV